MSAPTISAVNPVRVALVATLKTIPRLADPVLTGRVYHEGEVRRTDPLPRIVIGGAGQTRFGARYNGESRLGGSIFIRCWAADSWEAEELFAEALALLDDQPLTITGHDWLRGEVQRVTDYPEPDPEIAAHVVIASYAVQTRGAAV